MSQPASYLICIAILLPWKIAGLCVNSWRSMGNDWTKAENRLIIKDYFEMLEKELRRLPYNKAAHRRQLLTKLNRSDSAVEFKHRNISTVLIALGAPHIIGYKPAQNKQNLLAELVVEFLDQEEDWDFHFNEFSKESISAPSLEELSFDDLKKPPPRVKLFDPPSSKTKPPRLRKPNYVQIEQDNRNLGRSGEEMIMEYEKWWLRSKGKDKYADQIEWISEEKGDGAGFDILSRYENGKDKLIEVKTTKLSELTPFYFTRNEMEVSRENSDRYHLYRVYLFANRPSFFEKKGSFEDICQHYEPTSYIGRI